jgi:hypothetical protein
MPKTNPGPCVSYTNGKRSYLAVTDFRGGSRLGTRTVTVRSVIDNEHNIVFHIAGFKKRPNGDALTIAIEGTGLPAPIGGAAAAPGPDSGDLSITIVDGSNQISVIDLPVDYIDDDIP